MARARMLATDASIDPELNSLTLPSMTLYLLTIPHLDRDGLIDANPVRLAAQAAPLRPELRDGAGALINEWIEVGLVQRYAAARNQHVLFFKGFRKHNRFEYRKDRPSELPPPPGWIRTEDGLVPEDKEACFQLASRMHPENKYRKTLLKHAQEVEPDGEGEGTSRSVLEGSRSGLEDFSPSTRQDKTSGGGGVHTYTPPTPLSAKGGDARGGVSEALAEYTDDELRIAADALAGEHNLSMEYNGWGRAVSSWTRYEVLLVLAWCVKWQEMSATEWESIRSLPAVLRAKLRAQEWPVLRRAQVDELQNRVDDALQALAVPEPARTTDKKGL